MVLEAWRLCDGDLRSLVVFAFTRAWLVIGEKGVDGVTVILIGFVLDTMLATDICRVLE